jgi:hypothetical protein
MIQQPLKNHNLYNSKILNMKKIFYAAAWVLTLAFFQTSCKPIDDTANPNVITDERGVKIELIWSNTATNPIEKTDLDLMVVDKAASKAVLNSDNWSRFESLEVLKGGINNGTYEVAVFVNNIDRQTEFTIKCTGLVSGKTWEKTYGPINANDRYTTLKPLSLSVGTDRFTFN